MSKIFVIFPLCFLIQYFNNADGIKCYICNSRRDTRCLDPFNNATSTTLDPVNCAEEMSTRKFVSYFSKLLSTLGIQVALDPDSQLARKTDDQNEPSACQKVEIQDGNEVLIIRTCSILSHVACDPLEQNPQNAKYNFCEICDTDYCNNATHKQLNLLYLFSSVFLTVFCCNRVVL